MHDLATGYNLSKALIAGRWEKVEKQARKLYTDTIGPGDISEELAPEIRKLGLEQNCRELAERGWTVVENVLGDEFNELFVRKYLR